MWTTDDADLDRALAALAPTVDRTGARSAWSTETRRRSQQRRRRRVLGTTVVVLAASTSTWLLATNNSADRPTGPIGPPVTTAVDQPDASNSSPSTSAETVTADPTPFPSGPDPVFWMARTCDGDCTVGLPDGLPDTVVYADGTVMHANIRGMAVTTKIGMISDDDLSELRTLLASTGLSAGITTGPIPLPDGELMTEPVTTWFSARLGSGPVTQGVVSMQLDVAEPTEPRRTWAELAYWAVGTRSRVVDGDLRTSDRWVVIASSDVSSLGDVAWEPYGDGLHCAVFTDPDLTLTTENETTWSLPADVRSLRPALPHETDCTAVAAWDALRSGSDA